MNIPPTRGAFFDGEVEFPSKIPGAPALKLALKFIRTTREWATWAGNMAKGLGDPIQSISTTATLDFPNLVAGASADLAVSVQGVLANDLQAVVSIGLPAGLTAGLVFQGWVSADDVVTVRCTNASTGAINPASANFRVEVRRYE